MPAIIGGVRACICVEASATVHLAPADSARILPFVSSRLRYGCRQLHPAPPAGDPGRGPARASLPKCRLKGRYRRPLRLPGPPISIAPPVANFARATPPPPAALEHVVPAPPAVAQQTASGWAVTAANTAHLQHDTYEPPAGAESTPTRRVLLGRCRLRARAARGRGADASAGTVRTILLPWVLRRAGRCAQRDGQGGLMQVSAVPPTRPTTARPVRGWRRLRRRRRGRRGAVGDGAAVRLGRGVGSAAGGAGGAGGTVLRRFSLDSPDEHGCAS